MFEVVFFLSIQLTKFSKTSPKSMTVHWYGWGAEVGGVKSREKKMTFMHKKINLQTSLGNKSQHKAIRHLARITEHALMCLQPFMGGAAPR